MAIRNDARSKGLVGLDQATDTSAGPRYLQIQHKRWLRAEIQRKAWRPLHREGIPATRCTVARQLRLRLSDLIRGKPKFVRLSLTSTRSAS